MNGPARTWLATAVAVATLGTMAIAQGAGAPDAARRPEIPGSAAVRTNPQPATPENLAQGKSYFGSQCAMCHGVDGKGRGDLAVSLGLDVPDFTDAGLQRARTDGELFYVLVNGHGDMPGEGEGRLPEAVRWNMILHVRTFAGRS